MEQMKLKVQRLPQKDSGKKIVRLNYKVFKITDLKSGDIIKFGRERKYTIARALPAYTNTDISDNDISGIIQLDDLSCDNIGVSPGDEIEIEKTLPVPAENIDFTIINGKKPDLKLVKKHLLNKPFIANNNINIKLDEDYICKLKIVKTVPGGDVMVTRDTSLNILEKSEKKDIQKKIQKEKELTYKDIGGLKNEIKKIRELVEIPLKYPDLFKQLGIDPPRGILLYGPPGTGKTLIARVIASETEAEFLHISGPEVMQKYYGESEARLREIFTEAKEKTPSIVFLDEIDAIAARREEVKGEVEKRVVAQLLALMDGLEARGKIIVIGATNIPDAIDPALRRPGRFDREIAVGIPDKKARKEILKIHTQNMPLAKDVNIEEIAKICHGFVGADLAALCREAAMNSLRNSISISKKKEKKFRSSIQVSINDFESSLREIQPSVTRDVVVEVPEVRWSQVGGLKDIKDKLIKSIEWPFKYSDEFQKFNLSVPRGIMLSGPPGTGKTLLAKAIAGKIQSNFISIKGPELLSKWVGESEKGIRKIFIKARQAAPCILFFDEIDALTAGRQKSDNEVIDRVVSQFLTEMDGIQELFNVIVIGATNRIDIIDKALLRAGRFDLILNLPLPNFEARLQILKIHSQHLSVKEGLLKWVASRTKGFSGADLALMCQRISFNAFERYIENNQKDLDIHDLDFKQVLRNLRKEGRLNGSRSFRFAAYPW